GSEQGFDGFVAKHQEGGHCAKAGRECVVPASAGDPLNDLFAAEFFEIVGSVAGAVRHSQSCGTNIRLGSAPICSTTCWAADGRPSSITPLTLTPVPSACR